MLAPAGLTRVLTLLLELLKIKYFSLKEDGHPPRFVYVLYYKKELIFFVAA